MKSDNVKFFCHRCKVTEVINIDIDNHGLCYEEIVPEGWNYLTMKVDGSEYKRLMCNKCSDHVFECFLEDL